MAYNSRLNDAAFEAIRKGLPLASEEATRLSSGVMAMIKRDSSGKSGALVEDITKVVQGRFDSDAATRLRDKVDAGTMDRLKSLNVSSPMLEKLDSFVSESPRTNGAILDRLARSEADETRIRNEMRLSAFPANLTRAILEQEQPLVAKTMTELSDWQSGRAFYQSLVEHVNRGGKLSETAIDGLAQRAKLSDVSSSLLDTRRNPDAQFAIPGISDKEGWFDHFLNRGQFGLATITRAAADIRQATQAIKDSAPEDKAIVLLGRGTMPLVPSLREALPERSVQYFPYTRNQLGDKSTRTQWLKEVPPNSTIIDTGFNGSIFKDIKSFDKSQKSFFLIASSAKKSFPQLIGDNEIAGKMAYDIETFPKLIGRTTGYTADGNAISRARNVDDNDERALTPSQTHQAMKLLLRQLDLDPWYETQYSRFTGLKPAERLGLSSPDAVVNHFDLVANARAELKKRR